MLEAAIFWYRLFINRCFLVYNNFKLSKGLVLLLFVLVVLIVEVLGFVPFKSYAYSSCPHFKIMRHLKLFIVNVMNITVLHVWVILLPLA